MADGSHDEQEEQGRCITDAVNADGAGSLGTGGSTTVLGTFMRVGFARQRRARRVPAIVLLLRATEGDRAA